MQISPGFFAPEPHDPLPALEELRQYVLARSEKRCPKWRFRLAPDLVIQVRPRPVTLLSPLAIEYGHRQRRLAFRGTAVLGDQIQKSDFEKWSKGTTPCQLTFELYAEPDVIPWWFRTMGYSRRRNIDLDVVLTCRARLQAALTPERFSRLTTDLMFSPHCLCCGKALTDPASMARWIGPECAHNSSLVVPRVVGVNETPFLMGTRT